jgi:hypothetical protein
MTDGEFSERYMGVAAYVGGLCAVYGLKQDA